jgi:hypothetical protein
MCLVQSFKRCVTGHTKAELRAVLSRDLLHPLQKVLMRANLLELIFLRD